MKKSELAIGDSTELLVSYTSGVSPGRVNKYATIMWKDTATVADRITLHADVVPQVDTTSKIQMSSLSLDFSVIQGEKPKEKKLSMKNLDGVEYKVNLIDYPQEFFKVKLDKKLKSGKSIELKVKPIKDLPAEGFKRSLTLELEGKEKTRVTIPLVYSIVTPVLSTPKK